MRRIEHIPRRKLRGIFHSELVEKLRRVPREPRPFVSACVGNEYPAFPVREVLDQRACPGECPGTCPVTVLGVVPTERVGALVEIFSHLIHAFLADDVRHFRSAVDRGYEQCQFRCRCRPGSRSGKTSHIVAAVAADDLTAAVVELLRRLVIVLDIVACLVGELVLVVVAGDVEINSSDWPQHILLHKGLIVHPADLLNHHGKSQIAEV